jgi:BTB/POZ domain
VKAPTLKITNEYSGISKYYNKIVILLFFNPAMSSGFSFGGSTNQSMFGSSQPLLGAQPAGGIFGESRVFGGSVFDIPHSQPKAHKQPPKFPIKTRSTASDTTKLWELKLLSDFTVTAGKKDIQVHRNILALQSPVLASLFMNDEQVKASNKLEIKDSSEEVVEEFLRSLYTGEIANEENSMELFSLASTFKVEGLQKGYETIVIEKLDEKNALDALKIGNIYKSDEIIEAAFKKLKSTHPGSIISDTLKHKPEQIETILEAVETCQKVIKDLNV